MTPEEALQLAKTVSDIYATATADLLAAIARATAKGLDRPDWAVKQLVQILPLRREAQQIVARMQTAGPAEIQRLIGEVYAAQAHPTGGLSVNPRTVTTLAADTIGRVNSLGPQLLRTTEDLYRSVVAETLASAATGAQSRRQAAAAALDRFAKAGVGGFTDSAGRRWTLESYTEMATRTALGRAHLIGTLQQYADTGVEHVIVSNSPEECPQCRPYEGKILSLNADVPPPDLGGFVYAGTLADAISHGLHHPNCTHRTNRFIPGLSKPMGDTENPDGYLLRQRQRELERRVRESKRRVAAQAPLGDTPEARRQRQLLAHRQQHLDAFIRDNDRKAWVSRQRTSIPGGIPAKQPGLPTLTPEPKYVEKLLQGLRDGQITPDAMRQQMASISDLGRANATAALQRYERELAEAKAAAATARTTPTTGILSSEQYEMLRPAPRWSQARRDQIADSLKQTVAGRHLLAGFDRFQSGGVNVSSLRNAINRRIRGETVDGAWGHRADAWIDAVRNAPESMAPATLYRGMAVDGTLENVMARYQPGARLDLGISSFTSDRGIAVKFQNLNTRKKTSTRVMIELVGPGKKAVPVQNLTTADRSSFFQEREWVSMGRYRIVEVKKSPSGGIIIRIQQEGTL